MSISGLYPPTPQKITRQFISVCSENYSKYSVHIKIADYGISRFTAPNGSKGFGGTEGFMAPEIIRYNGEEEYTEKVSLLPIGSYFISKNSIIFETGRLFFVWNVHI